MTRVVLLGEDRAHRQFMVGLAEARRWTVLDEQFAPAGQGAASAWVRARFVELVPQVGRYPDISLLVAIDGDGADFAGRRRQLQGALSGPWPRQPIGLLVPCWCIDTWALFFARDRALGETGTTAKTAKQQATSLFRRPSRRALAPGVPQDTLRRASFRVEVLQALVNGFLGTGTHASLPALELSRHSFRALD